MARYHHLHVMKFRFFALLPVSIELENIQHKYLLFIIVYLQFARGAVS